MYSLIEDLSKIVDFQHELVLSDTITLDTETSSLDVFSSTWLLLQIKTTNKTFIFDVRKLGKNIGYIIELIKSSNKLVLLHNAKFDIKVIFINTGIMLTNIHDSMITEVLINQGIGKQYYSLAELVQKYCNITLEKEVRESFYNYSEDSFTNELLTYSALDVEYLEKIYEEQLKLIQSSNQVKVYDLEMKLVAPVVSMELNGVTLDRDAWIKLKEAAIESIITSKEKILDYILSNIDVTRYENAWKAATALLIPVKTKKLEESLKSITNSEVVKDWFRENINISSPKQIKGIFNLIGIPLESTGENELQKIRLSTPLADLLLTYREHTKKLTTYGDNFLDFINLKTNRIHAEFNQVGTQSGRGSSSSPNLQNLPREESYRHCFTSGENKSFVCMDYVQQEFKLAGAVSKEDKIIDAYKQGLDMHIATASILFNVPLDKVTKEQRFKGKTTNFSVLYGSSKYGLSYKLQVDIQQAEDFLKRFADGFPKLILFKELMEGAIWKKGFSCTPLGRKRYFEKKVLFVDGKEASSYESRIKRELFNHILQGGGADATKIAMCNIYYNNPFGDKLHLCMQIHDEIVCEVDDDIAEEAKAFQEKCMVDALQPFLGAIPAVVSGVISKVWSH